MTRVEGWLLVAVLLAALAAGIHRPGLLVLACGLLLIALAGALWNRWALSRIEYRQDLSQPRCFQGDEPLLTLELHNRKMLPLPWLHVSIGLPPSLQLVSGQMAIAGGAGHAAGHVLLSLAPYERRRRRVRLRCSARGAYELGPVTLHAGDPFGVAAREIERAIYTPLLVYPRAAAISDLGLPARHPFGERSAPRRLIEDPSRTAGARPYQSGDIRRHVHWKATARLQQLQTRLYEPSTRPLLMLYVNLGAGEAGWWSPAGADQLELAISAAAGIATWATDNGYQVGAATNGAAAGRAEPLRVAPSSHPRQLQVILELLARISRIARLPMERMLERDRRSLPVGTTIVLVTTALPAPVAQALEALRSTGHAPVVLAAGADLAAVPHGIPTYAVGGEGRAQR